MEEKRLARKAHHTRVGEVGLQPRGDAAALAMGPRPHVAFTRQLAEPTEVERRGKGRAWRWLPLYVVCRRVPPVGGVALDTLARAAAVADDI